MIDHLFITFENLSIGIIVKNGVIECQGNVWKFIDFVLDDL